MSSKKIFLIRNVAPEKYGGGETYQLLLAKQFKKHGFEPVILANSKELLSNAKKDGIDTIVPPYNKNQNWSGLRNLLLPIYYIWQKKLTKYYKDLFHKERPYAINVQSRDDWIAATLAAKNTGIKVIWTDHMDFRSWVLWNIDKKFKNHIGKSIIKIAHLADKIIFISDCERNWFASIPAAKHLNNCTVIKNGAVDKIREYKNVKKEENSFCYVGRIIDYKGIHELICAFNEVSSKYPDTILNIYGDGPDLVVYQKEAETNKRILFHGYTNEPLRAIAENETFILPSYREGLSLSLLDAVMMQRTVISTNVGAAGEVIENKKSGLLIRPHSIKALSSAMLETIENKPLSEAMAKNARINYEQNYNFEQIFKEKMLPIYNDNEP